MSDMGNTDLGEKMGNRGVSAMKGYRVPQSGYQMPTQKLGVNPAKITEIDPEGTQKRWSSDPSWTSFNPTQLRHGPFVPGKKTFVRSGTSVGGFIPQPKSMEDF